MKILFETERLIVRQWELSDAPALYEYASDPEVMDFMPFPIYTSMEMADERMRDRQEIYAKHELGDDVDWAICEKENPQKAIGSIGTSKWHFDRGVIEFGYLMNKKYQGKGYMTEAVIGLLKYLKANAGSVGMNLKAFEAKFDPANKASGRVMEKVGMRFAGTVHEPRGNNRSGNKPIENMQLYRISTDDLIKNT